jgi:hypothetical protein
MPRRCERERCCAKSRTPSECGLSPMTTTRESLPLYARSMHFGCARARWGAHAAWHSAARVRAPAHGESLPHGSNARRHARAALLAVCAPVADDHHASLPHTRCSIDAHSAIGCSRCMALGSTCQDACPTPSHGKSLPHGSNARRQTRVQPCSLWTLTRRCAVTARLLDRSAARLSMTVLR